MGQARFVLRTRMAIEGDRRGIKMTYRLLAAEAKVSTATLSRMASNEQKGITLDVLERICNALHCSPNDLLWAETDPPQPAGPLSYDEPRPGYEVIRESE